MKIIVGINLIIFQKFVLLNEDEVSDQLQKSILLKPANEREVNRIKPNPTLQIQPIFIDPSQGKKNGDMKANHVRKGMSTGLCLEISGRVQHDSSELKHHDHLDVSNF
ncbi:putative activating signal cointegrator 1 [Helianthus annuus]|nr:putative activating signal cointegrator 1 [Helianthus annuus]